MMRYSCKLEKLEKTYKLINLRVEKVLSSSTTKRLNLLERLLVKKKTSMTHLTDLQASMTLRMKVGSKSHRLEKPTTLIPSSVEVKTNLECLVLTRNRIVTGLKRIRKGMLSLRGETVMHLGFQTTNLALDTFMVLCRTLLTNLKSHKTLMRQLKRLMRTTISTMVKTVSQMTLIKEQLICLFQRVDVSLLLLVLNLVYHLLSLKVSMNKVQSLFLLLDIDNVVGLKR